MHTIRSFIAIPLATDVRRSARKLLRDLKGDKDGMKWVPEDDLHLTLKFLGDVEDREVPKVCLALQEHCQTIEPFSIEFSGTGGFPDLDRARVIWAGITDGGAPLVELVSGLERRLADLGFKPEPRDYRPHLTLGRVRSSSRAAAAEVIARARHHGGRRLGVMTADHLCLIASYLDKTGPSYHVMDTVWFGAEAAATRAAQDDSFDDEQE